VYLHGIRVGSEGIIQVTIYHFPECNEVVVETEGFI
jgi:hypothetical protein